MLLQRYAQALERREASERRVLDRYESSHRQQCAGTWALAATSDDANAAARFQPATLGDVASLRNEGTVAADLGGINQRRADGVTCSVAPAAVERPKGATGGDASGGGSSGFVETFVEAHDPSLEFVPRRLERLMLQEHANRCVVDCEQVEELLCVACLREGELMSRSDARTGGSCGLTPTRVRVYAVAGGDSPGRSDGRAEESLIMPQAGDSPVPRQPAHRGSRDRGGSSALSSISSSAVLLPAVGQSFATVASASVASTEDSHFSPLLHCFIDGRLRLRPYKGPLTPDMAALSVGWRVKDQATPDASIHDGVEPLTHPSLVLLPGDRLVALNGTAWASLAHFRQWEDHFVSDRRRHHAVATTGWERPHAATQLTIARSGVADVQSSDGGISKITLTLM